MRISSILRLRHGIKLELLPGKLICESAAFSFRFVEVCVDLSLAQVIKR